MDVKYIDLFHREYSQHYRLFQKSGLTMVAGGFTLIELLIVIAIIGILAGVILVSTNSARNKAVVAAAKHVGKSTMVYTAECTVLGGTVLAASNGGAICNPYSGTNFSNLAGSSTLSSCNYAGSSSTQVKIDCGGTGSMVCNVSTGSCH